MSQAGIQKGISSQRLYYVVMAALVTLLLAVIVPAIVAASSLSTRSIMPSTASVTAAPESVQYTVKFTPDTNAGAVVIDFCNSASGPLLGQSCTGPTGMDVSEAAIASGATVLGATDANTIFATKSMTAGVEQTLEITGLTNPTTAGTVYARIVTYADGTDAAKYLSDNPSADGAVVIDNGSVAMYFNDSISVSGTVLETLTFCVSGSLINANCAGASTPVITLGEETDEDSGIFALTPGVVSEGTLHTQINTNAANGVVVRLKSTAPCGGLIRAGSDQCDIAAALDDDVVGNNNSARFGVKTATATNAPGATSPIGTLQPYVTDPEGNPNHFYLTSRFSFNYDDQNPTTVGVTSTFGDPFLDTAGAPATGKNMALTFGASVSTNTPAGLYSTDLSLIAVGKF